MNSISNQLKTELTDELTNILNYWIEYSIDDEFGGFVGKVNDKDEMIPFSEKGAVLNARILWSFSAAYCLDSDPKYLEMAERAFNYLIEYFADKEFGGVYWSVDFSGKKSNTRKQIYGQAFVIYALAEYYKISKNEKALNWAIELFEIIEKYSFDNENGGYLEALAENWQPIENLKLSEKDANEKKSMNTHLHILEAYTNLIKIWNNDLIYSKLKALVKLFISKVIDPKSGHQQLFFDENWNVKSSIVSYGHDIETSWLLYEAAIAMGEIELINETKILAIKIVNASMEGLLANGGLAYEKNGSQLDSDKHWWVQAEAIVGFYNAYQLSGDEEFLENALEIWNFTKKHIIAPTGEWYWGANASDNSPMSDQDKIGFWKCPYHNARACIEIIERVK